MPDPADVEPWEPDAAVAELLTSELQREPGLVILPRKVDGSTGVYEEDLVTTAKELRRDGAPARYLHTDPDDRRFLGEYSADVLLALAIGVSGNLTYDQGKAVCQYVLGAIHRRRGDDPNMRVRVNIARLETDAGVRVKGLSITGPTGEVAERILKVLVDQDYDGDERRDS